MGIQSPILDLPTPAARCGHQREHRVDPDRRVEQGHRRLEGEARRDPDPRRRRSRLLATVRRRSGARGSPHPVRVGPGPVGAGGEAIQGRRRRGDRGHSSSKRRRQHHRVDHSRGRQRPASAASPQAGHERSRRASGFIDLPAAGQRAESASHRARATSARRCGHRESHGDAGVGTPDRHRRLDR